MKVYTIKLDKTLFMIFFLVIIFGSAHNILKLQGDSVSAIAAEKKTVVIDAGHGGWDPGKVGSAGEDEKDINLKIATRVQQYLEQSGIAVMITRVDDEALGDGKTEDMKERKKIANDLGGDILISIHQNAFPSDNVKGAQVFYHKSSEEGKRLAEIIQEELVVRVDPSNKRQAKSNSDYYILRTTEIPAAIVECGFLSNNEEELKLNDERYQDKLAWAIYVGILEYFENENQVDI